MTKPFVAAVLAAAALLSCAKTQDASGSAAKAQATTNVTATDGRLSIWLTADDRLTPFEGRANLQVWNVRLHFKNASTAPLRILVPDDRNRGPTSSLYLRSSDSNFGGSVPEWPRHGPMYTEQDFYLLAPGEERSFAQPVFPSPRLPSGKTFDVTWRYEVTMNAFPGGIGTLQPSHELFGGKPLPDLWNGKLETKPLALQMP
ncbi:hypothetical protein AKJ09_10269 [Labilithrix luteola]|uniref:Lipoprotein n=1 Tax=Labilithrix luteola TaxID=1391654 RepID=A0A0K1QCU3_9BACT|nr:hypothetical protein [Labilithrix luteola]AKV03606.1 hypothetical protein AKJ09_10269 [Labilithrix luteola]